MKEEPRALRVLHVGTMMWSGGLEKWLVELALEMYKSRVESFILVQTKQDGLQGRIAREKGVPIIVGPRGQDIVQYTRSFVSVLRKYGPFDAVHCHLHNFSALVLLVAAAMGVPVRIAHSHENTSSERRTLSRMAYRWVARHLIFAAATHGFGAGDGATRDLFGDHYSHDRRWQFLPCGISLHSYLNASTRAEIRKDLGISTNAFCIVQVGRLNKVKNQEFSIRLLAHNDMRDAILLLVGEGLMEKYYRELSSTLGVHDRVIFAGTRSDIAEVLCAGADVFLFPSIEEAQGIALIEAQAAGLPCVISDTIPALSDIIPELITRLSLQSPLTDWVAALQKVRGRPCRPSVATCVYQIQQSPFSIESNARLLADVYSSARQTQT